MRKLLHIISLLLALQTSGQSNKDKLIGDWKLYLNDKISFEFLRLNQDGSGIKCIGQTINGKDTLFINHITALKITSWKTEKRKLIIQSDNTLSFDIKPDYKLNFISNDKIELEGEHLIFYLYPSRLNRKEFQRKVTFQKAENIIKDYGITTKSCISSQRNLFIYKQIDSSTKVAEYKGFDDLIPYLVSCNNSYEFVQKYNDKPYSLKMPNYIKDLSFGFGNKLFYISLNSIESDTSETSIVIYYDFGNENKDYYFSQLKNGKEKKNIVKVNGIDIYKSINWQGKYEGKIFLENSIYIAYYTKTEKFIANLQQSITSFKYR
jgi:hypothetical protein